MAFSIRGQGQALTEFGIKGKVVKVTTARAPIFRLWLGVHGKSVQRKLTLLPADWVAPETADLDLMERKLR